MARKENSHWPCLSHVVLCVVRECGQLGLNQKSKVLLEEEGSPVGHTEDVFSTMLGGASSGLPPALVCVGILAPHSTHLPAPYFLADLALASQPEVGSAVSGQPPQCSLGPRTQSLAPRNSINSPALHFSRQACQKNPIFFRTAEYAQLLCIYILRY